MGGDGGSLPTRGDLVKEKEKEEKANPQEQERSRWTTCRLSAKPLGDDVVTCKFGMLYNRSEAVQYMADVRTGKRAHVAAFAHLNTLKDLVPLRPKRIDGAAPDAFPRWQCPITLLEANGQHAFCASRPCGCVISVRAVKEAPSALCLACNAKLTGDHIALLKHETMEQMPPLAAPSSRDLILLQDSSHKTPHNEVTLYQSPLERMREKRDRERAERERVEEEKRSKAAEERRLLDTRKVGALLPPPPPAAAAPAPAASASLTGRRRDIHATLDQLAAPQQPVKRAHTDTHTEARRRAPPMQTSAAKSGHLASLFSASFKKAA